MTTRRVPPVVLVGICAVALGLAVALDARQPAQAPDPAAAFAVRDEMIPMRDGVKLFTQDLHAEEPERTAAVHVPAHALRHRRRRRVVRGATTRRWRAEGYIFVFQDIRGKFKSEGEFVMQRPARAPGDTKSLDEGTDTYDTIEWLLKNVPQHNGRVGMLGV